MLAIQQQWGADLELLDVDDLGIAAVAGGSEGELDEAGAGEHCTFAYHVVDQPGQAPGVELALPGVGLLSQAVAQQRVFVVPLEQLLAIGGATQPIALALPGVAWQLDQAALHREPATIVKRYAAEQRLADGLMQARRAGLVALQGGEHQAFAFTIPQRIAQVAAQDGVSADLDEQPGAVIDQRLDGVVEAHRLADVVPPVLGTQLAAGQVGTGHGGDIGQPFRQRRDGRQ